MSSALAAAAIRSGRGVPRIGTMPATFASTKAHVGRAALEAVSHQLVDFAAAFAEAGASWRELRIDGGMAANDWLAQDIADMTGLKVGGRPMWRPLRATRRCLRQ